MDLAVAEGLYSAAQAANLALQLASGSLSLADISLLSALIEDFDDDYDDDSDDDSDDDYDDYSSGGSSSGGSSNLYADFNNMPLTNRR